MSFSNPLPAGIRQVTPDYVSDGAALAYNFPFRLWAPQDLAVLVLPPGATLWQPLAYATQYAVALLSGGLAGATATLVAAQPAGTLVRLQGLRTPSRLTSVVNGGAVQSAPFESELDCIEATLQELRRDTGAEAARALAAEAALANALAVEVARAEAAEGLLTTGLAAETTRAQSAEAALPSLLATYGLNVGNFVTNRQARAWLAAYIPAGEAALYLIDNAVPADIANAVTIQWRNGMTMQSGDALYIFIENTLALTGPQMAVAFTAMKGLAP